MNLLRIFFLFLFVSGGIGVGTASAVDASIFKIYIEHSGVYEIGFDGLVEQGLEEPQLSAGIGLRNFGEPVPLWIEDGGDGYFDPGDRIVFLGEALRGDYSYLDPYSRFNCYVLDFSDPAPWVGESRSSDLDLNGESAALVAEHHLESDQVMVRFRSRRDQPDEEWYWARLSVADRKPFTQEIAVAGLPLVDQPRHGQPGFADVLSETMPYGDEGSPDSAGRIQSRDGSGIDASPDSSTGVLFRIGFRGWSEPRHRERASEPHHQVDIRLNGATVSRAIWDGTDHQIHEFSVPLEDLHTGANELALKVHKRFYPKSGDLLVDVVLLNWIELEYEHIPELANEQLRLSLADPTGDRGIKITTADGAPLDLYLPGGVRIQGVDGVVAADLDETVTEFSVLRPGAAAVVTEIVLDRPSDLFVSDRQVDYIMITHRSLWEGTERLAEFHRGRGLTVEVVDVQDVYDEFNFGVLHPTAIKDFLQHAHLSRSAPAPRFVLLVGDASWDFKNTEADDSNYADWTYRPGEKRQFVKNSSTPYEEGAELNHRNLVPTSSYPTLEGHAASDTWFVCFDDGDLLPDMAIGRLPVVNNVELDGVIEKTIRFSSEPPVGPWRRNLLFIANESASFQKRSDQTAEKFSQRGFVPTRIYPHPSEPANEHHTRRIIDILDDGVYGVHFIGHGGRYIWRTGPPDLQKNHDLFTLDHLEELADNTRLPVVLSLTCYSAPFDHPSADSIGEKLLRIPRRGAIAVFAASWRNSPSPLMGELLFTELTIPGNTIGEAIQRAKQDFRSDALIQTYNLLGDPAVPVGAPAHTLGLTLDDNGDGLAVHVEIGEPLGSGRLVADWVALDGSSLREDQFDVTGTRFSISLDPGVLEDRGQLSGIRVYVWDEERHIDGIGWVGLATEGDAEADFASGDGTVMRDQILDSGTVRDEKGES